MNNALPSGNFLVSYLEVVKNSLSSTGVHLALHEVGFDRVNQALNAMDVVLNDTDARNVRLWAVGSDGHVVPLNRVQFYKPAPVDSLYSDTEFTS